jgi:tetratricopeptide (TPR) repeat protein
MVAGAELLSVSLLLSASGWQSFEEWLRRGIELAEAERWDEAETALGQAAEADPLAIEPHVELARLYLKLERGNSALVEIDRALALRRGEFELLFLRGLVLMEMEKFDFAAIELAAALARRPDDAACRKALGSARFRAGDFEGAIEALEPLLKAGGVDSSVQVAYGGSLLALKRYEAAANSFRENLASSSSDHPDIALGLVEAELRLGHNNEARQQLEPFLTRHAKAGRVWFLKGFLEESEQRYTAAVESFRKSIELGHDVAEVDLRLGVCLARSGDRNGAWSSLEQALSKDPRLADAHYYQGILLSESGDPSGAAERLERAATLAPEDFRIALALADVYLALRRYDRALEEAQRAARDPLQAGRALYFVALAHHQTNQLAQAKLAYREAIARGADSADLYLNLGKLLLALSELTEARDALVEALRRDSSSADTHLQMGIVETQRRKFDAALPYIERALEISPSLAEAWYRKGVVHSFQGNSAKAVESWRKALALDPESTQTYYRLGTELVKLGQIEEGEKLLHDFRERSRNDEIRDHRTARLENVLMQALLFSKEGRDEEALQHFEQALSIDPESALIYPAFGEFHLLRGRPSEAEAILHRGLAIHPESISMRELLLLIYQSTGDVDSAERERKRLEELKTRK